MDIDPPPINPVVNRAEFFFEDFMINPTFAPGEHSQWLVLTVPSSSFPDAVVLDVDRAPFGVHGDVLIDLVPEPTSSLMLILGGVLLTTRRKRRVI